MGNGELYWNRPIEITLSPKDSIHTNRECRRELFVCSQVPTAENKHCRICQNVCGINKLLGAAIETVSKLIIPGLRKPIDLRKARLPASGDDQDGGGDDDDNSDVANDDYDPRDHRNPAVPIKVWMAYFNYLRTLFGAGVLGLPIAVSQAGMVLGPMLIVFTGILVMYTHGNLIWLLTEISRQLRVPRVPYCYGFKIALAHGPLPLKIMSRYGLCILSIFMITSQIGICTVFVIFTTDSLRDMMDWPSSEYAMLVLLVPYLLLEYFVTSIKVVTYISMLGNILNLMGMLIVFYHMLQKQENDSIIMFNTNISAIFLAFGTCLFNMSAVGVVLALERVCKDPRIITKKYGVINVGIVATTIVFCIFGCLGYWAYGVMEENILRSLPFDDSTTMVVLFLYMTAIVFAYPITCMPATNLITILVKDRYEQEPSPDTVKLIEVIVRPCFVLLTFLICYVAPYQGPMVAFVGFLCTTQLILVLPALMDISIKYPSDYGPYKVHLIKNFILVFVGLSLFIFGVYMSGKLLIARMYQRYAEYNQLTL